MSRVYIIYDVSAVIKQHLNCILSFICEKMLRFISSAAFSSKHNPLSQQEKKQNQLKQLKCDPQVQSKGTTPNVPIPKKCIRFVHLFEQLYINLIDPNLIFYA